MVQPLPGFLHLCLDVCSPCQVLGDVYTEVLEAAHPFHRGCCCLFLKSTISSLVLLTFRERQLSWHHDVSLSTSSKYAASSLLETRPRTTVSSANLTMEVELCEDTQSWVYREYSRGLRTQPCGAPTFRVMELEVNWPTFTTCGLAVRKSWIQSQSEVFRPRSDSLTASLVGTIVLKAEL